jgi:hypothetical protein
VPFLAVRVPIWRHLAIVSTPGFFAPLAVVCVDGEDRLDRLSFLRHKYIPSLD